MYRISSVKTATVRQMRKTVNRVQEWDLGFRRDINDWEVEELSNLLSALEVVHLDDEEEDRLIWKPESDGEFKVSSFNKILMTIRLDPNPVFNIIWEAPIPYKVCFFSWEASLHKIHTQDRLQRCGITLVNRCHMCKRACETVLHLLFTCDFASKVWSEFLNLFGVSWVFPNSVEACVLSWESPNKKPKI
ncbi:Reverse transcriptase zinc-binding domain [Macleaya cordata]|uniref:Reverse transcriptase zinc-binding domain n=1 Tax=Macleaya cordata TaxID=56857 RepID=A0A200PPD8_MACCD|nr:Reverse transcriptase zinc-binding domain [Macleaya cordata]